MKKHFREDFSSAYYEFYETNKLPNFDLVTCVFGLIKKDDKIYLTKNFRGWELPGGHLEKGENLDEALIRELKEEVGTTFISSTLFGYKKYTNSAKLPNREGGFYPFPHSYILFYLCEGTGEECKIDCPDTLDYGLFTYEEALEKIDSKGTKKLLEIMYS